MIKKVVEGLGVALVTPFAEDRSIDFTALRKLVRHVAEGGADNLVVLGTTGEVATQSDAEQDQVIQTVIEEASGLAIVIGCGGNDSSKILKRMCYLEEKFHPDAFLSVSPYYNKPSQNGIIEHYKFLDAGIKTPIILYNVPGRTASNLLPQTVKSISESCKQVVAIKESSGDFLQAVRLSKVFTERFSILSGDDYLAYPMIKLGAKGLISVLGNAFPAEIKALVSASLDGEDARALQIQNELLDFMDLCFEEGNPSGVKSILSYLGVCEPFTRLPLIPASQELNKKVEAQFEKHKKHPISS